MQKILESVTSSSQLRVASPSRSQQQLLHLTLTCCIDVLQARIKAMHSLRPSLYSVPYTSTLYCTIKRLFFEETGIHRKLLMATIHTGAVSCHSFVKRVSDLQPAQRHRTTPLWGLGIAKINEQRAVRQHTRTHELDSFAKMNGRPPLPLPVCAVQPPHSLYYTYSIWLYLYHIIPNSLQYMIRSLYC